MKINFLLVENQFDISEFTILIHSKHQLYVLNSGGHGANQLLSQMQLHLIFLYFM